MDSHKTLREPDVLLLPYLRAKDEAEAKQHAARLAAEHAEPILKAVIGRKLRVYLDRVGGRAQRRDEQEAEEVYRDALMQLLSRLNDLRDGTSGAIGNFRAYVAATGRRACDQYLRQKYPQRWSLKNQLRYVLTHQPGLSLWEAETGEWIGGFTAWRDQRKRVAHAGRHQQLRDDPQAFARTVLPHENLQYFQLADLLAAIYNWLGGPVELDDLVNIVSDLRGVKEFETQPITEDGITTTPIEELPETGPTVVETVDQQAYLQRLWMEIWELPPRQSAALLLNLRDAQGRGIIALLPLMEVASIRQIAEALAVPLDQFAALWNKLPLDDAAIAHHLDATRQQVINLRKVARERLARRMRTYEEKE